MRKQVRFAVASLMFAALGMIPASAARATLITYTTRVRAVEGNENDLAQRTLQPAGGTSSFYLAPSSRSDSSSYFFEFDSIGGRSLNIAPPGTPLLLGDIPLSASNPLQSKSIGVTYEFLLDIFNAITGDMGEIDLGGSISGTIFASGGNGRYLSQLTANLSARPGSSLSTQIDGQVFTVVPTANFFTAPQDNNVINNGDFTPTLTVTDIAGVSTPEPGSMVLIGSGALAIAGFWRLRRGR